MARRTVNKDLDKFVSALMAEATKPGTNVALEDKLKIVDRALKLEALKQKIANGSMGAAFGDEDEGVQDDE